MSTQPNPENFPSYRAPSRASTPRFSTRVARSDAGAAFQRGAKSYDDARPGYPKEVAGLVRGFSRVLDVGAGSGKLTRDLGPRNGNERVFAIDPSQEMCEVLRANISVPVWRATAEATALPNRCVDAAVCAQAWHWCDVGAASSELDRVIAPHGRLVLAWNTLAVEADPWLLRLSRIMHSGDIHRAGFVPEVSAPWRLEKDLRLQWAQATTPEGLHELMHTRAYWLRAKPHIRERMTHNLNWYLFEHMGFAPNQELEIIYRTDAFAYARG